MLREPSEKKIETIGRAVRAIALAAHDVIQFNVDTAEPFHPYSFPNGE